MRMGIDRIQSGLVRFMDNELMPQIRATRSGLNSFGVSVAAALAINNLPNTVCRLKENAGMEYLGVINDEGIEIDELMTQARVSMPQEGIQITLPVLGTLTFHRDDIDKLEQYIKS